MSELSRDEVARLAGLARIALSDEELDRFAGELAAIVDSVAKVSEVATADVPATSHPMPLVNVFRPDANSATLLPEQALGGAPAQEQQRFKVPQILGEDEQ